PGSCLQRTTPCSSCGGKRPCCPIRPCAPRSRRSCSRCACPPSCRPTRDSTTRASCLASRSSNCSRRTRTTTPRRRAATPWTPAHHVLGLAAGVLPHLPKELLISIAAAHGTEKACDWLQAGWILATGEKTSCPGLRIEAYITHLADSDYDLTGLAWKTYVAKA